MSDELAAWNKNIHVETSPWENLLFFLYVISFYTLHRCLFYSLYLFLSNFIFVLFFPTLK